MVLIVGLGNPEKKYQNTRHNLGFKVIEGFQRKNHFLCFKEKKKCLSEISEGILNNKKIILAKPQTFMNNSGKAVRLLVKEYLKKEKQKLKNLWVVHDDLDLPLGKIKISFGRGSAGHKGVQSIINELKTKNFVRFRLGISPLFSKKKKEEKFVLENFKKSEEKIVQKMVEKTIIAIEFCLKEDIEKGMQKFNK